MSNHEVTLLADEQRDVKGLSPRLDDLRGQSVETGFVVISHGYGFAGAARDFRRIAADPLTQSFISCCRGCTCLCHVLPTIPFTRMQFLVIPDSAISRKATTALAKMKESFSEPEG